MLAYIWTLRLTGESSVTDHFLKGVVFIFLKGGEKNNA